MKKPAKLIVSSAHYLDVIASICMVVMMVLIVSNVLMRSLFRLPIFGTFELVGFLAAIIISFAIANCGVKNGHIAVDLFMDKFPKKVQLILDFALGIMATYFLGLFTWHMARYGYNLMLSGEVSSTTRTPLHIFVYLVAFGLLLLTIVNLHKTINLLKTPKE